MLTASRFLFSAIKLIPASWILPAIAVAAPFLSYGYATLRTKYEVRAEERAACTQRIASIEKQINAAAERQIAEARDAAAKVPDTPAAPADLARLCQQSPTCRDRVRK